MVVSEVHNCNCLDYMRDLPDGVFDLALADPPYGLGTGSVNSNKSIYRGAGKLRGRVLNQQAAKFEQWDKAPGMEFFTELFRIARNVIIWGGNYFPLPPTRCVVCWDKVQPWENFSQIELAWTSFDAPAKLFRYDNRTGGKIHATQKPVELYAYLLRTFGKEGDKIFDPMLGSQSSRIAAYKLGFDFWGCEIDEDYFASGCRRFDMECKGITRTVGGGTIVQPKLFEL